MADDAVVTPVAGLFCYLVDSLHHSRFRITDVFYPVMALDAVVAALDNGKEKQGGK